METSIGETVGTPRKSLRIAQRRQSVAGNKVFLEEQDAQLICALGNGDSENKRIVKARRRHSTKDRIEHQIVKAVVEPESPGTPRRRKRGAEQQQQLLLTPKSSAAAEAARTPRRSARKSIKPAQDYEDIVNSKAVRSLKKDSSKGLWLEEEEEEPAVDKEVHRWTPSKVGRVSEKRKSRKARRNFGAKKCLDDSERIHVDPEVLEVVADDEDENKENVEPQELLRNRKSPKGNESKGYISARRSMEVLQESKIQTRGSPNKSRLVCDDASAGNGEEKRGNEMNEPSEVQTERQSESSKLEELGLVPMDLGQEIAAENIEQQDEKGGEKQDQPIHNSPLKLNTEEILETIVISPVEESKSLKEPPASEEIMATIVISPVEESKNLKELPPPPPPQTAASVARTVELENTTEPVEDLDDDDDDQADVVIISDDIALNTKEVTTGRSSTAHVSDSELNSSDCIIISPLFENTNRLEEDEQDGNNNGDAQSAEPSRPESPNLIENDKLQTTPVTSPTFAKGEKEEMQKESKIDGNNPQTTSLQLPKITLNDKEQLRSEKPECSKKISIVTPLRKHLSRDVSKPFPYRRPTPYKADAVEGTEEDNNIPLHSPARLNITNMEPKEFILRSIRKRSYSASTERPTKQPLRRVKFHSPANRTTAIEDLDKLIAMSAKKSRELCRKADTSAIDASNVTKRRKRSFSVDEATSMRRQVPSTPLRDRMTTPQKLQPRTKIPNFAAIHQRQFNKMENLVDHVSRKAERAKQLINSSSKLRSTQKPISSNKPGLETAVSTTVSGTSRLKVNKPTALKQLDLSEFATKKTSCATVNTLLCRPFEDVDDGDNDDENVATSSTCNLPDPRLFKNLAIVQPLPTAKVLKPTTVKKVSKPTQEQHPKPPFNLSTKIKNTTQNCSISDRAEAAAATTSALISSTSTQASDKVSLRRQRHMDMFKGRAGGGGGRIGVNREKDKSSEIIRGVRSNRRFDLQMQHRKNLCQD